jgi:hypothetical protein
MVSVPMFVIVVHEIHLVLDHRAWLYVLDDDDRMDHHDLRVVTLPFWFYLCHIRPNQNNPKYAYNLNIDYGMFNNAAQTQSFSNLRY